MNEKFQLYRKTYDEIIYHSYKYNIKDDKVVIEFTFEIPDLKTFKPTISFNKNIIKNKNINDNLVNMIVFRIGLIELISYYKCVCPKKIVLKAGYLDDEEQKWFKKLFYNGLGEFLYINNIDISEEELFDFINEGNKIEIKDINYEGESNLIPIGGGKDSCVTLELLKNFNNKCYMINPKDVHFKCAGDNESYFINRTIDPELLDLNKKGFLNGHTPFSAIVAFSSYLIAYLTNCKNIILSNEGSANESTVLGTSINHQYSKTYEFEKDFYNYTKKYFKVDINYFSFLRPLKEIQIASLFSEFTKYHSIFRSCNLGSKESSWKWCCNCPKCLFTYIMLRAFLNKEYVIDIFGENLLDKKELEKSFLELIGQSETKPFDCIGTVEEVKYALNIISNDDNSYLTKLYKENYYENIDIDLSKLYYENNLPEEYLNVLKNSLSYINKIINKLQNYKNIAILGFGKEGKSTYNFIRRYNKRIPLTILDQNEINLNDEFVSYKKYNNLEEELKEFDLIIKSPGIAVLGFSEETYSKITSQLELLLEVNRKNVIGITGTKGKSTTSTLIYDIFKDQLPNVHLVGNIGIPIFDEIENFKDNVIVAEMSSHQLEFVKNSPHVGVILNLFVDHLDHTGSIEKYHAAKMNIAKYQDENDFVLFDADNEYLNKQDFSAIRSSKITVSNEKEADIYLKDNIIYIDDTTKINKEKIETKLQGDHNLKNIMFALKVASLYNLDLEKALISIKNFKPLEHRLEFFGKYHDISFYDDAIATIPEATINACKTLKDVDTLIFGGMDRNIDYDPLIKFLNESNIRNFVCMPTTGYKIAESLDQNKVYKAETLEDAVKIAFKLTEKNKICLLSPAASSYEYFKNFEEKGNKFKELVENYK